MSLATGTKLGPYELIAPIGAGGMGEVYRARDQRLGRDVAVKVIPASFASDPIRLRRFEQEARAAASLNHPNILAVYDVGVQDGSPYIVSELLEGETLLSRLRAGSPLPIHKAVDYAQQVAHGLAAAHDKGIIHRDLKPENIFITVDGRAKILDFGLAKLTHPDDRGSDTVAQTRDSEPGSILGTVGYMSPEQVRGQQIDARSDLFNFGAVLYEMLSGRRAFHGETAADTMSAILHTEPEDIAEANPRVPPALQRIVRHCLEKDPHERFHSAHDIAFDLEALSATSNSHSVIPAARLRDNRHMAFKVGVLLAVLVSTGAIIAVLVRRNLTHRPVPTLHQVTFRRGTVWNARFAPDGKSVAYGAAWEGNPVEIFQSNLDSPEARSIGLTGADVFSIRSNGDMAVALRRQRGPAGFNFNGMLARVPLTGGPPREILDRVESADWGPDGSLAVAYHSQGKARLEFPIGTLRFESSTWIGDVRVSPKGEMIAFIEHDDPIGDGGVVRVVGPKGAQTLTRDYDSVQGLAWSPAGDKIWFTAADAGASRNLHVVDLRGHDRLVYRVPGTLKVQDVAKDGRVLLVHELSRAGILAHVPGIDGERELGWLDWSLGRKLSEDGKWLLFDESGDAPGNQSWIYLRMTDGSPPVRLGEGTYGDLSPDGKWVAAVPSDFSAHIQIIPTGAGQARTFQLANVKPFWVAWLPNQNQLLVRAAQLGKSLRGYVFDLDNADLRPITPEGVRLTGPSSPDGKFAAGVVADGTTWLFPISGGNPRPIALHPPENVIGWSADAKAVYAAAKGDTTSNIYRVGIDTGQRELFAALSPADKAGLTYVSVGYVTRNGKYYIYSYNRQISELFVVEGLD